MLIDTHTHLQSEDFAADFNAVLQRAKEAGLEKMICVGYDLPSSVVAVNLARKHREIYAVIGVHPHDAKTLNDSVLAELHSLAQFDKVVAIGEIGLDYYRDLSPREEQRRAFISQMKLAQELGKPIVIHDRDAHQEVFELVKQEKGGQHGGVMHCFSGHVPLALDFIKEGFYISLSGNVTFQNNKKGPEVACKVPLDRLLIETDCPYLTPEPFRGKRNEPSYVKYVAAKIAELRKQTEMEIAYITNRNAHEIFRLPA